MLCDYPFPARYTPEAKDYAVDWIDRLQSPEAIAGAIVNVQVGDIVVSDVQHDATTVTFWITGGSPVYQRLVCTVTTNATPPRVYEIQATIACYP